MVPGLNPNGTEIRPSPRVDHQANPLIRPDPPRIIGQPDTTSVSDSTPIGGHLYGLMGSIKLGCLGPANSDLGLCLGVPKQPPNYFWQLPQSSDSQKTPTKATGNTTPTANSSNRAGSCIPKGKPFCMVSCVQGEWGQEGHTELQVAEPLPQEIEIQKGDMEVHSSHSVHNSSGFDTRYCCLPDLPIPRQADYIASNIVPGPINSKYSADGPYQNPGADDVLLGHHSLVPLLASPSSTVPSPVLQPDRTKSTLPPHPHTSDQTQVCWAGGLT